VSRLRHLHRRATSRRAPRPPLALTHPVTAPHVWGWLLALAAVAVAALWALERWLITGPTKALDRWGVEWLEGQRTTESIAAARVVTHLGDAWVVALIAGILVVLARRRAGRWDSAILVTVTVGGAMLVTGIAKEVTARARPEDALTATVSHAFPSGHASRAAVVCLLVAWISLKWSKHPVTRHVVVLAAVVLTLAAAWSRVLLGAHWPTDVVAGIGLGAVWLAATILLTRPVPATPDGAVRDTGAAAEDGVAAEHQGASR
jgi:membrane-associated phospholipid phosphatase